MATFTIEQPTTVFFTSGTRRPLEIYLDNKLYHLQATDNRQTAVKFPLNGSYHTREEILSAFDGIKKPAPIALPKQERFGNNHLDSRVSYNPTVKGPAKIFWKEQKIEVGPLFSTLPIQFQRFILLHEMAHCYFENEFSCDLWALNKFMQEGYNASQAFYALENVLSHSAENLKRAGEMFNKTSNFAQWN